MLSDPAEAGDRLLLIQGKDSRHALGSTLCLPAWRKEERSGAIMPQKTVSMSHTERAASAEVAGDRIIVEKAMASARNISSDAAARRSHPAAATRLDFLSPAVWRMISSRVVLRTRQGEALCGRAMDGTSYRSPQGQTDFERFLRTGPGPVRVSRNPFRRRAPIELVLRFWRFKRRDEKISTPMPALLAP